VLSFGIAMIVFVAVIVAMVIVMRVIARRGTALTGRLRRHSTAGLTVVAAAVLSLANLDEVVREHHSQLRRERRIVRGPVRQGGAKARPWSRVRFRHAEEPITLAARLLRLLDSVLVSVVTAAGQKQAYAG
jgi:hypothetical protein